MKRKTIPAIVIIVGSLLVLAGMVFAAQDRFTLKGQNGVAFSEFRGYETWPDVAASETDQGLKVILANPVMIKAYKEGVPANGKAFPEGSVVVKIEWSKKKNPESPYSVMVPDTLKSVAFIRKDSKRFPDTNGWGYTQFLYYAASVTLNLTAATAHSGRLFVTSAIHV